MPMIINCTSRLAAALLFCASLSFIGLGVQPPEPEWGAMLAGARGYIRTYPYMLISLESLSHFLLSDLHFLVILRDAMDPET